MKMDRVTAAARSNHHWQPSHSRVGSQALGEVGVFLWQLFPDGLRVYSTFPSWHPRRISPAVPAGSNLESFSESYTVLLDVRTLRNGSYLH